MIELSFAEILVVVIVGILLIKPADIPKIAKLIRSIMLEVNNWKSYLQKQLSSIEKDIPSIDNNTQEINYYMKKICDLGGAYSGDYNLDAIKSEYQKLFHKKSNTQKVINNPEES